MKVAADSYQPLFGEVKKSFFTKSGFILTVNSLKELIGAQCSEESLNF